MPLTRSETLRKLTHIGFGFCAVLMAWLTTWQTAAVALAALLFNWLVLPHAGGKLITRDGRGNDAGILLYPFAVLVLVLAFPSRPEIAAAVWAFLAFGDGSATLAGKAFGGPRIPWNRDKSLSGSLAFLVVGGAAGYALHAFLADDPTTLPRAVVVFVPLVLAALIETLPLNVDDNVTVPLTGALAMFALSSVDSAPGVVLSGHALWWLALNAVLATAGYLLRTVDLSGYVGGFLIGAVILIFGGWQLYVILLLFFAIGTGATKLGFRAKAAVGLAQEKEGRRGVAHAFSNTGVAAMLALLMHATRFDPALLWLAAAGALATAAADTTASEVGQLIGRRAFLPLTFRRVAPGTEGAISIEGTLAGAVAAVAVALVAAFLSGTPADEIGSGAIVGIVAGAAIAGSYIESIAGSWNRTRTTRVPNGALNFFNTLVGAGLVLVIAHFAL
ncbi:MAG: DUF92 domain-containing protein [Thermoanaerobaculia bacterium]